MLAEREKVKQKMTTNLINPPEFTENTSYENFLKEVQLWLLLVEGVLDKKQMGPALFKSIKSQRAKEKVLELDVKTIGSDGGVDEVIKKLDEIYLLDKDQRIYLALDNFETFRRDKNMDMSEFVTEFESRHNKIKQFKCVLPDGVLAYKILKAVNLTEH